MDLITDIDRFGSAMQVCAATLQHQVSVAEITGYSKALRDLPIELIEAAFERAAEECKFFPKPVELRALVLGSTDDRGAAAWEMLFNAKAKGGQGASVLFRDGFIGAALKEVFGGWVQFCECVHQVWGNAELSKSAYEEAREERELPESRPVLLSGLSDEMIASYRKRFLLAYRTAERARKTEHYLVGAFESNNRASAGWERPEELKPVEYVQSVCVVTDDVKLVACRFEWATGKRLDSIEALMSAPPRRFLPVAPEQRQIGDGRPVEEIRAEVLAGLARFGKRATLTMEITDEEMEKRKAALKDQARLMIGERTQVEDVIK